MQDTTKQDASKKSPKDRIEGEGSYSGTKAYNEATAKFIEKGKVEKAAQEAKRAIDSGEAAELQRAEAQGKAGDIGRKRRSK
jgi:hypothetical protein